MLDALRKGAGSWIAQIFIGVLVLTFAIWGIADVFNGFRADSVAEVGRTNITIAEYQRQLDRAIRQFNQQYGQQLTLDQARTTRIPAEVLSRLVSEATLNDTARSLGLGVSGATLAGQIVADPTFRGVTGAFDRAYFNQILRSAGLTEDAYMAEQKASYVRAQLGDALTGGLAVPDSYMRALHEYRNEARSISYVTLLPAAAGSIPEPSDTDLQAFFDAHKADYRAPEFRAISMLKMAPTDLAKPDEVSDEDAKKIYDQQLATTFTTPERRKVEQIVFADKADADKAGASLAAGKTFDDLMAERNLKPTDVDLGLVDRTKVIDPAVADAAFGMAEPGVSPVIAGRFGPAMVRVTEIQPQKVTSFEDAKADIKKKLADQRAASEISDQRDVVEDARAGGQTLAEIGKKYDIPITTIPAADKNGDDDKGAAIKDLPSGLVAAAFASDVGVENEPIAIEGGFVWYDVTAVTPEHDRELKDVRDKVAGAWRRNEIDTRLKAKAGEIRSRLAGGEDIAKVAVELGVEVKTIDSLTRTTDATGDLTVSMRSAAFAGPKGSVQVADGPADQSKVVLVVTGATVPPYFSGAPDLTQAQQQLASQFGLDILQQYVTELQSAVGIRVNQNALNQALGTPASGT